MSVRDLGYRAYEGDLLPASHNTWVLLRYGLWRIWGSWVNRIAIIVGLILPLVVFVILAGLRFMLIGREMPEAAAESGSFFADPDPAAWLRRLSGIQFWFFVTVITLRSGAGVIAEDFTHHAYPFYFAKPVTPIQYFVGRAAALAIFVFAIVFIPTLFLTFILAGLGPEDQMLASMGLILPALLDAAVMAVSCSVLSVAVSALSKSRALTFTAWVVVLFVPFVLASLVEGITESEWMYVASLPGLLWVIGDALYRVHAEWQHIQWYHAAPVLALLTAGGGYLALMRIRQAEVIA